MFCVIVDIVLLISTARSNNECSDGMDESNNSYE